MPSTERALTKLDDQQQMSVDELCLSVSSISLTGISAEKVIEQIMKDRENTTTEHHASADEDESSGIDNQQPKLDGRADVGSIVVIPIQNQAEEAFMSCGERVDEVKGKKEAKISDDIRTKHDEGKDESSATCSEDDDRIASANQNKDGTGSMCRCTPQEHDETTNELFDPIQKNDETENDFVARGPGGGVPVSPKCGLLPTQVYTGDTEGLVVGYEHVAKYRKPMSGYVPPVTFQPPDSAVKFGLMNGGKVSVYNKGWDFGQGYCGGFEPCQLVSNMVDNSDMNNVITEFLQTPVNSSIMSSGDFDAIMNSVNDNDASENLPMPTEMPPNTFIGISDHTGFPTAASPSGSSGSPVFDGSDCISPGFVLSPENPCTAMSPTSTVADSGLEDEWGDILEVISEDIQKDHTNKDYIPSCFQSNNPTIGNPNTGNPGVDNPRGRNPSFVNPSFPNLEPNHAAEMAIQNPIISLLQPDTSVPSVITTTGPVSPPGQLTCIVVPSPPVPSVVTPGKTRFCPILPRPPDYQKDNFGLQASTNTGLLIFLINIRF